MSVEESFEEKLQGQAKEKLQKLKEEQKRLREQ
jgi:hypothetical protein